MSEDGPLDSMKVGTQLVAEIIKTAGNDPKAKEAAGNLGSTAVTITKTINNALLPLAAVNFAFDKARIYFSTKFQNDLTEKASQIPLEHIVEPKASIAGPTLQGLAFAHEEQDLKDMFLTLITTSMDKRVADEAHPAFVEIIKQLDTAEARLLKSIFKSKGYLPVVEIRKKASKESSYTVLKSHILNLGDQETKKPAIEKNLSAMVDNWIRLGLVNVDYSSHLDEKYYEWVEGRPELIEIRETHKEEIDKIDCKNGYMKTTFFGQQFAKAVGIFK